MARWVKYSILPAAVAFAAFFSVLPTTGADREVNAVRAKGRWAFRPASLEIDPGDRIAFLNETSTTHSVICDGCPLGTAWSGGDLQPGQTKILTFPVEGAFRFYCRYHREQMVGRLVVGNPPPPTPSPSPSPLETTDPTPLDTVDAAPTG